MGRPIRYFPDGGTLVEVTLRTIHGRYLLRPDARGRVNEIILGILGRAQRREKMPLMSIVVLSNHLHLLAFPNDAKHLADFMCYVGGNLSLEIGRLHNWRTKLWERRYRAIPVSDEEEAQIDRLAYQLGAGIKEGLVERASDWPGIHSARALTSDHHLHGWWFDRTRESSARRRGERPGRYEHATEETVHLSPLPCWQHLPLEEVRRQVKNLIREIEKQAATERRHSGRSVLGAAAVMAADPHYQPGDLDRSPAPVFHAHSKSVRQMMRDAYAWVVAEYRRAAERLRRGEPRVQFPQGTFPPAQPFVAFPRGSPA